MNILLVINGDTGLQYHRQYVPHIILDRITGGNFINVTSTTNFDSYPDEKLKFQNIVYFLRVISTSGNSDIVKKRVNKFGARLVFDIDDYWELSKKHGQKKQSISVHHAKYTVDSIRNSDLVVTTTEYFASKIKPHNKNVVVLPNCIDRHEQQWLSDKESSEDVRFGWIGGLWHKQDIQRMSAAFRDVYSHCEGFKIVLGGYENNPEYNAIAQIMSGGRKKDERFMVVKGLPYTQYGNLYNYIDVSLVPLEKNEFNSCKSPLKLIEAGQKGCAVIASNVLPYSEFPDNTFLQVNNNSEWLDKIKLLLWSPQLRQELASNLKEYCKRNFDGEHWATIRYEIYKDLIK